MNRLRILHLEDNAADAELVRVSLEPENHDMKLVHAVNPAKYMAALEAQQFHAILVDNTMPTFSGLAALKEAFKRQPDVPVIVLLGNEDEKHIMASLAAGAACYIVKGDMDRLQAILKRICERLKKKNAAEE